MDTPRILLCLVALSFARPAPADPTPDKKKDTPALASQIEAVLERPEYKHARWGILAVDAATGKTVYARNADQLFAPASVTKLYSCAAALVALGADHHFETPVYRRGTLSHGVLSGDLILVASGDLTMGGRTDKANKMAFTDDDHIYSTPGKKSTAIAPTNPLAGLEDLARQVQGAGIKRITGDVLIDTRLFEQAAGSGSGPSVLTPVLVNDNIVDVTVKPGEKVGDAATYTLRPATDFLQIDVQVKTTSNEVQPQIHTKRVGPGRYTVRGVLPIGSAPQVRICMVDDPAGFARALFIDLLRKQGVEVVASTLKAPTAELPEKDGYAKLQRVALHRSLPLSEAIKVTLKVSHNLYASTLPLLVAVKHGKRTLREGMRQQGRILSDLGVEVKSISLESGAGGGDGDKVSPRATVQLLQSLRKRPDWASFDAALPVLGVDGTLADVVGKDSPARGKVRGKTGTYTDANLLLGRSHLRAKSLAGVMTTAGGKTLVFTIFVNDVPLPPGGSGSREGKTIGELCEILYEGAR